MKEKSGAKSRHRNRNGNLNGDRSSEREIENKKGLMTLVKVFLASEITLGLLKRVYKT